MLLADHDVAQFHELGFVMIEGVFSDGEVRLLRDAFESVSRSDHPANVVEKHTGAIRTAMGLHRRHAAFDRLVRDRRLVEPAVQLIGDQQLYAQQVKVNVKAAEVGEAWQWHYDFATHHHEDGVVLPLALNLHIFLDDVTMDNGPLQFVRGSHLVGAHETFLDTETTSYDLWCVSDEVVQPLADVNGVYTATGAAGSLLIFGDTLLHASPPNTSALDRRIFSLILNPVANASTIDRRHDWQHHREFVPIVASSATSLLL